MKKTLLFMLIMILSISLVKSQSVIPQGTPTQLTLFRGGSLADSITKIPVRTFTALYGSVPLIGRLQMSKMDSTFYYNNGVSWYQVASSNRMLDSISSLKALISSKISQSRTLSINGTSYDLSANRSWAVGDVLTSGSYSNPSWISSLSQSKITWSGSTSQYIRGDGSITLFPTNVSAFSNDAGYLIGVTSGQISGALGYIPYNGSSNPLGFLTSVNSSQIVSALGYTPYNGSTNPNGYATSSSVISGLAGKENAISSGLTTQFWRGDKTWQTMNTSIVPEGSNLYYSDARARSAISLTTSGSGASSYNMSTGVLNIPTPPTPKRQETYSGTTSGSGTYTVTFATAYSVAPNIVISCTNCNDTQRTRVSSISTTGFTVLGRAEAIGLIFTNANGLTVDVLITEK